MLAANRACLAADAEYSTAAAIASCTMHLQPRSGARACAITFLAYVVKDPSNMMRKIIRRSLGLPLAVTCSDSAGRGPAVYAAVYSRVGAGAAIGIGIGVY